MRSWYRPFDVLPGGNETVIGADSTLQETRRPLGPPQPRRLRTGPLPDGSEIHPLESSTLLGYQGWEQGPQRSSWWLSASQIRSDQSTPSTSASRCSACSVRP
ncbi:hypothetical protein GCM10018779_51080 [Streptomyces griseocarneus]|nr:hypothetical protein GCM10018779_51080 [Streptomyces griseocarneus]